MNDLAFHHGFGIRGCLEFHVLVSCFFQNVCPQSSFRRCSTRLHPIVPKMTLDGLALWLRIKRNRRKPTSPLLYGFTYGGCPGQVA